jgi:hypothetical protein
LQVLVAIATIAYMVKTLGFVFQVVLFQVLLWPCSQIAFADDKYSLRPSILEVSEKEEESKKLPFSWKTARKAHVEAVAEILEMYPDHEIYFLARDAEYLYDLAQLETENDPARFERIHLINVSRLNMDDPNLLSYLAQHGIDANSIAIRRILLVDTGFAGTIPVRIKSLFPAQERQIQTHFIASQNDWFPSTRTFLAAISPASVNAHPSQMRATMELYEYFPHFTNRSYRFEKLGEGADAKWEAMSREFREGSFDEGTLSKKASRQLIWDLKLYARSPEAVQLMKTRRSQWAILQKALFTAPIDRAREEVRAQLAGLLPKREHSDPMDMAIVRDFLDIAEHQYSERKDALPRLEDFGLAKITTPVFGNKNQLQALNPQWSLILLEPQNEIPKLLSNGQIQTLREILDLIDNQEFVDIALKALNKRYYLRGIGEQEKSEIVNTVAAVIANGKYIHGIGKIMGTELSEEPSILKELVRQLKTSPNADFRKYAVEALRVIKPESDLSVVEALTQALEDSSSSVSLLAVHALSEFEPVAPATEQKMTEFLSSEDPQRREYGISFFSNARLQNKEIRLHVARLMSNDDAERVRLKAAANVWYFYSSNAIPLEPELKSALAHAVKDPVAAIRRAALNSIIQVAKKIPTKDQEIEAVVTVALQDEDKEVREYAARALIALKPLEKIRAHKEDEQDPVLEFFETK